MKPCLWNAKIQQCSLLCAKVKNSDFLITGFPGTINKSFLYLVKPALVVVIVLVETLMVIINIYCICLLCVQDQRIMSLMFKKKNWIFSIASTKSHPIIKISDKGLGILQFWRLCCSSDLSQLCSYKKCRMFATCKFRGQKKGLIQ